MVGILGVCSPALHFWGPSLCLCMPLTAKRSKDLTYTLNTSMNTSLRLCNSTGGSNFNLRALGILNLLALGAPIGAGIGIWNLWEFANCGLSLQGAHWSLREVIREATQRELSVHEQLWKSPCSLWVACGARTWTARWRTFNTTCKRAEAPWLRRAAARAAARRARPPL